MDRRFSSSSKGSSISYRLRQISLADTYQVIMNRFLTRKKDRGLDNASPNTLAASGTKKAKKGKKGQPEPMPQLDLTNALPSSDNFRTSLLMPGLSTRFSMLREQDDPNSKLGKASDDSVLHPKRLSRLHEFGFAPGGLSDIAEVSSLNGSIRPPFAVERQNSFDSNATGDDSNPGSMMSRARPGEGNVLFGGRQKVYKVSNNASSRSLGRALYDDDVSMSTFQKLRLEEKEKARQLQEIESGGQANDPQNAEPISPTRELAYSPSTSSFTRRRETSSTTSGTENTRTSTAATSIASQGANSISASSPAISNSAPSGHPTSELNRSTTKARRLYDQGLDQHLQEQQSSSMNRLNSIQRTRAPTTGRATPPFLAQVRSATNLNDRFNRAEQFRSESPTPMSNTTLLQRKETQSSTSSPAMAESRSPPSHSPPLGSPVLGSDNDEATALHSALQPGDRGKATAMGAFNRPKQAFDEQQYAQRLKQMQQGRETPPPRLDKPAKPSLRERAELEQRKRAEAGTAERSRSDSSAEKQAPSAFSVFQNAANQMRTGSAPTSPPEPQQHLEPTPETRLQPVQSPDSTHGTTFFASSGDSSDDDGPPAPRVLKASDLDSRLRGISNASTLAGRTPPPILEHPALRSRANSAESKARSRANSERKMDGETKGQASPAADGKLHVSLSEKGNPVGNVPNSEPTEIDSPTLGPNSGLGGLIRQHLRNVSAVSSDYGEIPDPPLSLQTQTAVPRRRQPTSESDTPSHSGYSHSNPWDLEDLDRAYGEADSISSASPVDAHRPKPLAFNGAPLGSNVEFSDPAIHRGGDVPHWENELKSKHQRDASTETQQDREAYQREVAQRQRAIQESIRNKVGSENNSRSASPAAPGGSIRNALGMLRSKSSRDSFATNDNIRGVEPSTKAMRMLGLGAGSANASSTSLAGQSDRFYGSNHNQSEEDRVGQRAPSRMKPNRVLEQSEQDARRELGQKLQRAAVGEREPRSKGPSPPASSRSSTRNRSSSELSSGRSRSRTGRYRDDLERAMAEGTGGYVYPPNMPSPSVPGLVANQAHQSPESQVDTPLSARLRSNSRSAAASYFDSKSLHPIHTGHANGASPRLSPAATSPKPGFSPGLPLSPRPSPGAVSPASFRPQPSPVPPFAAPYSANSTPPLSTATTPIATTFASQTTSMIVKAGVRKQSVKKSEISEPVFVSATSVMDTVDLPAGASLKNGMEAPPPVPPINPRRRRFGFGRSEEKDKDRDTSLTPPQPPFAEVQRTNSADAITGTSFAGGSLRKTTSEGHSLHAKAQPPVMMNAGIPPSFNSSPPRPSVEGGMF